MNVINKLPPGTIVQLIGMDKLAEMRDHPNEIGVYEVGVTVGKGVAHFINFPAVRDVLVDLKNIKVIAPPRRYEIGDKVFYCTYDKSLIRKPFTIIAKTTHSRYRIEYENTRFIVFATDIIPYSFPNRFKKNALTKE